MIDINAINHRRVTALIVASQNGHIKVVDALIKAGADLNYISTCNARGTALMSAIRDRHIEVINALIKAGAEIDIKANERMTGLIWASYNGYIEAVNALLAAGLDVTDENGSRALRLASREGHTDTNSLS